MMEKIFDNIEIIEPFPAIYLEDLDLIIIADLHLGYESAASEDGMFIPKIQYKKTIKDIEVIYAKKHAKRILINGDVKHEFSETSYHEYREVSNFFEFLKRKFDDIIIIKGNHDNFIVRVTKKYEIKLYDMYNEDDFFFIHGHKDVNLDNVKQNNVILGHEHPSIGLISEIGVKEKVKCFLYGEIMGKNMVVMPAFSYFAQGSDVNLIPKKDLLSPILRKIDVDSMKAIGIVEGEKCLSFPKIKHMREEIYES